MSLIPVDEALARLLDGVAPLPAEEVSLADAPGRVLAEDVAARLTQPPFPASAMDGYAVRAGEARQGAVLKVAGVSRAGERYGKALGPNEAVRIFTGAPVPEGADTVLIQENATAEGDSVRVDEAAEDGRNIRAAGLDFRQGDTLLRSGTAIDSRVLALAAAMGQATLAVRRRPKVAILANGDELVPPGTTPGPDQIVSSNGVGLAAFVRESGGEPIDLGIAPDRQDAIAAYIDKAEGADVLSIIGGASVGDHDLVKAALEDRGTAFDFWRIAMRPGKPLMVGRLKGMRVLGLPGNPVSALVCAHLFLRPLIRTMLGLPGGPMLSTATLGAAMGENDGRQDYVRARLRTEGERRFATPFARQDSSMLSTLVEAGALIVRPPHAPAIAAGGEVRVLILDS